MGYVGFPGAPLFLMLGDSITEIAADPHRLGFQSQLAADYIRKADVINRGISGWTTKMWLRVLADLISEWKNKQPTLIVIFLGTNDASLPDGESKARHVPLEQYEANLKSIVAAFASAYPACKFLILSPPPVNNGAWSPTDKSNTVMATYAAVCLRTARELAIPAVDFYSTLQGQWDLLADGLHFNAKGMVVAHAMIAAKIKEAYPHLTPDALPHEFEG
ncbi:isoamyl acetate-hydrolyzing esterase [Achlya hypogyna]|uniref:Isoamyl acetate-hydrolyzing esterase n=1 Tax=Achlya hypogyna TaxID=1202772 RepID=A0A1V9YP46_ACHHY|nr:isoamyl acetate-hydrolyzing esterase [Achlya hypogyna]